MAEDLIAKISDPNQIPASLFKKIDEMYDQGNKEIAEFKRQNPKIEVEAELPKREDFDPEYREVLIDYFVLDGKDLLFEASHNLVSKKFHVHWVDQSWFKTVRRIRESQRISNSLGFDFRHISGAMTDKLRETYRAGKLRLDVIDRLFTKQLEGEWKSRVVRKGNSDMLIIERQD